MCCCGKPTINGQPGAYSWDGKTFSARAPSPPNLADGDELIYDEPGRCGGLDSHSHHFRLVKMQYGGHALLVRHGGGDERIPLGYSGKLMVVGPMESLNSDARYWLMHGLYSLHRDTQREAAETTAAHWRKAAAEKRIKTRRLPKQGLIKVWFDPERRAANKDS